MAGTISFGGVGSGMDTEAIVTGLVNASKEPLNAMKSRASNLSSATSTLSKIASLMAKLKTALEGVDEAREIGSFKTSTSGAGVVANAAGNATPGSYAITVAQLASEQRSYSNEHDSSTTALGLTGNLGISVAGAAATDIALSETDTLEDIAAKINSAGLRASASVLHDGSKYYLQVRGLDTGKANEITFSGTTLGLDVAENTRQKAQDSQIYVDDFKIERATNQVVGAIPGVTLNLTEKTTSPVTVKIENDPEGLKKKLTGVIEAYNAVIDSVHSAAGFGSTKATEKELAGDSLLRSIAARMSSAVTTAVSGSGQYTTLASLGVSLGRDGKLSLDGTKLDAALNANPSAVAAVIAGPSTGSGAGAADLLRDVVGAFTQSGTGLIATRQETLQSRTKSLNSRIDREQARLDRYAEALRKTFTTMDGIVASNNAQANYLYF